jgi:hypothetical protein
LFIEKKSYTSNKLNLLNEDWLENSMLEKSVKKESKNESNNNNNNNNNKEEKDNNNNNNNDIKKNQKKSKKLSKKKLYKLKLEWDLKKNMMKPEDFKTPKKKNVDDFTSYLNFLGKKSKGSNISKFNYFTALKYKED